MCVTQRSCPRPTTGRPDGSKRGLFLAALRAVLAGSDQPDGASPALVDLLLVATLELAPRDAEVHTVVRGWLAGQADAATVLGRRLLSRAALPTTTEEGP